jgi:hypothetical protein
MEDHFNHKQLIVLFIKRVLGNRVSAIYPLNYYFYWKNPFILFCYIRNIPSIVYI